MAGQLGRQCSREPAPRFDSASDVLAADVRVAEAVLAREWEILRAQFDRPLFLESDFREYRPHDYVRQYVGLVIGGRKVMYLNAMHKGRLTDNPYDWKSS